MPHSSLQVFENESHASIHSTKTKEGLSLFGLSSISKYRTLRIFIDKIYRHAGQHKNNAGTFFASDVAPDALARP